VFAHPHPDRPSNVAPILDPYEAASKCLAANGSTLLNRTIRVDAVTKTSEGIAPTVPLKKGEGWVPVNTDPKKSIFIGGLDYAAKEEDLRVLFETLVTGERGEREGGGKWVESIRIIRDKQTQLGKGFGYVHFTVRPQSCI
jgi:nucleolar protein 12